MTKVAEAADLFCGAGGTSTGLLLAAQALGRPVHLVAINHWKMAIETHSLNHPYVDHYDSDLEELDPRVVVPEGWLRLLVASPECTHHSRARGGKPMSKQSRATPKYILRWVGALDIEDVLIENVPEFQDWGPLHRSGPRCDLPIIKRKGEYFHRFIKKLEAHGYTVDWRVLTAADYGDATTRKRLFIICRKHKPIKWPEPTHSKEARNSAQASMFFVTKPWRPAAEIIDWSILGKSIFNRKKPLAYNTMRRISAGFWKISARGAFIIPHYGERDGQEPRVHSVEEPLPTVVGSNKFGLGRAFILSLEHSKGKGNIRSVDEPMPTLTSADAFGIGQPFIVPQFSEGDPKGTDKPLGTITTTSRGIGLGVPYVIGQQSGASPRAVDEPLPTVAGAGAIGLSSSFLVPVNHGKDIRAYPLDQPMPTITALDAWGVVSSFLVSLHGTDDSHVQSSVYPVFEPVPSLATGNHIGLAEPFITEYYGTGGAKSLQDPLPTQTAKDRFLMVQPWLFKDKDGKIYMLDILYRMLQPKELAGAMSFPSTYVFVGNREESVKQIGNAVPVELAKALCQELLRGG